MLQALKKFYRRDHQHPVVIPARDAEEMQSFIHNGPSPHTPPEWIDWSDNEFAGVVAAPASDDDVPNDVNPAAPDPAATVDPNTRGKVWTPFMQPRPRCVYVCY